MNPEYPDIGVARTAEWNEGERNRAAQVAESAPSVVSAKRDVMLAKAALAAANAVEQASQRSGKKRKRDSVSLLDSLCRQEAKLHDRRRVARDAELQKSSLHSSTPAFLNVPMGAHSGAGESGTTPFKMCGAGGVNSATPPDMLHQFSLGLMKRAVSKTIGLIRLVKKSSLVPKGETWATRAQRLAALDIRLATFNVRHNGETSTTFVFGTGSHDHLLACFVPQIHTCQGTHSQPVTLGCYQL
jgi:hypothetical protein